MAGPRGRLKVLIGPLVLGILADIDFVSILLSEAVTCTRLEQKVEQLTDLVHPLVRSLVGRRRRATLSRETLRTALAVIFLGVMSTLRLARASSLGISGRDVARFVSTLARDSRGVQL